jgi:4-hydroxy-3-polyprenylbenzoate decarboxylase
VFELGDPPPDVVVLSEEESTEEMAALIREAPRTWKQILQHFIGQPYRAVYGAFSNLRHQLGRCDGEPWYRYTFSDTDFAVNVEASSSSNSIQGIHRTDRRNETDWKSSGLTHPIPPA